MSSVDESMHSSSDDDAVMMIDNEERTQRAHVMGSGSAPEVEHFRTLAAASSLEDLQHLLVPGMNTGAVSSSGDSLLLCFADLLDDVALAMVSFCCEVLGLDVLHKNKAGMTALFRCACVDNPRTARFLCQRASALQPHFWAGTDANGQTPLFYAAREGQVAVLVVLVEFGHVVDAVSPFGSPVQYASKHEHHKTVKWLLDHGARFENILQGNEYTADFQKCAARARSAALCDDLDNLPKAISAAAAARCPMEAWLRGLPQSWAIRATTSTTCVRQRVLKGGMRDHMRVQVAVMAEPPSLQIRSSCLLKTGMPSSVDAAEAQQLLLGSFGDGAVADLIRHCINGARALQCCPEIDKHELSVRQTRQHAVPRLWRLHDAFGHLAVVLLWRCLPMKSGDGIEVLFLATRPGGERRGFAKDLVSRLEDFGRLRRVQFLCVAAVPGATGFWRSCGLTACAGVGAVALLRPLARGPSIPAGLLKYFPNNILEQIDCFSVGSLEGTSSRLEQFRQELLSRIVRFQDTPLFVKRDLRAPSDGKDTHDDDARNVTLVEVEG